MNGVERTHERTGQKGVEVLPLGGLLCRTARGKAYRVLRYATAS